MEPCLRVGSRIKCYCKITRRLFPFIVLHGRDCVFPWENGRGVSLYYRSGLLTI